MMDRTPRRMDVAVAGRYRYMAGQSSLTRKPPLDA
jgi:hypothetical protein